MHLIGQEIALVHIKATVEGGSQAVSSGDATCLYYVQESERGEEGKKKPGMLLLHLNVCQRDPSSVSFTASFHFVQNSITPSIPLPLSLSPLSE